MPWRVGPAARADGVRPDPYRVWLSEVMLQQTTVPAVIPYFEHFTERWPTVAALAAAEDGDVMAAWAGLGYYARARNLLKCAREVAADHGGQFPDTEAALLKLPGIGPYTAAAIAFDRRAVVLDGNVERVMARLHTVETPLPDAKPELRALADALTPSERPGDYAQAVMDLGATICRPRNPACGICPWMGACLGRQTGLAPELPRKRRKAAKPVHSGIAWLGYRADGAVLLETRPDSGLLGGMLALPTSPWVEGDVTEAIPPLPGDWRSVAEVRHTFTHFHLRLEVRVAKVSGEDGFQQPDPDALPTVMRKALLAGLAAI